MSQESSPDVVREALKAGEGYLVKADAARELRTAVSTVLRSKRFVGSRFVGQGFPEASDSPTQRVENKNVFASLEQTCSAQICSESLQAMFVSHHDNCIVGLESTFDELRQVIQEMSIVGLKHCLMAVAEFSEARCLAGQQHF